MPQHFLSPSCYSVVLRKLKLSQLAECSWPTESHLPAVPWTRAWWVHLSMRCFPLYVLAALSEFNTKLQGISNKAAQCQTCGQKLVDCTGHFGMLCF